MIKIKSEAMREESNLQCTVLLDEK